MANVTVPVDRAEAIIMAPEPRCWLVWKASDGSIERTPVASDASVLNIERDLISHLNVAPIPDAWLENLRDYCSQRLSARAEAAACDAICVPSTDGKRWRVL